MSEPTPEAKLTELVLYVGAKCALDEHYGALKLNKILFYSDFLACRALGQPITGVEYRKYTHGPAPAMMGPLKARLHDSSEAFEYHNPLPQLSAAGEEMCEKRLLPRRAPRMELFTPDQIVIVDQVIERLRPMTGRDVSLMSHRHPGWALTKMGEEIPYKAALLPEMPEKGEFVPLPLSSTGREWALAAAQRFAAETVSPSN